MERVENEIQIVSISTVDTETGEIAPPDISVNRVKRIFSSIAPKYKLFNAVSSFGAYRLWLRKMVEIASLENDDDVLDLAAGTGDVTFALAKEYHPTSIVCSDLVPEMLSVAEEHLKDSKADGTEVTFEVIDAQNIPYPDSSFDAVTIAYGLRNIPDRSKALSEIHRVLKPGGKVICLDFSTPGNPIWKKLYSLYLSNMIPLWGKLITGDSSGFKYLSNSIKSFPDQTAIAALFKHHGFVDVEWTDCAGGISCIHRALKPSLDRRI